MLPVAFVVHASRARVRVRLPDRRGDLKYFAGVRKAALKAPFEIMRVNAFTGSILFAGRQTTGDAVAAFGTDNGLFTIQTALPIPSLAKRITAPLTTCNRSLKALSGGRVDLPEALFILLLFTALYEIARGRFRTPPWYTAFWYAFGLFTKTVIDRETAADPQKNAAGHLTAT
jgi:hypothetical protein